MFAQCRHQMCSSSIFSYCTEISSSGFWHLWFKKKSRVMCLEYIVDYFGLNSTFLDELKILLCFVLICSYRRVPFGPWSSPGLRSVGKILCSSISNSLFFGYCLSTWRYLLCVEGWGPAQSFCGCVNQLLYWAVWWNRKGRLIFALITLGLISTPCLI